MSAPDHFSAVAKDYEAARPHYPAAFFDWLQTRVSADAQVWEPGCGSGQATVDLADRFAHITATDVSEAQLSLAPTRANVRWICAPAERSGLPDRSVDLIVIAQALHWFDRAAFYAEVQRVLRPGGWWVACSYSPARLADPNADACLQAHYREVSRPWWPPGREHVDNGYRDLPTPFAEQQAPAFPMQERWSLQRFAAYVRSWSASVRQRKETGVDAAIQLTAALQPWWPETKDMSVHWTLQLRACRLPEDEISALDHR